MIEIANDIFNGGNDKPEQPKQSDSEVVERYRYSPLSLTVFERERDGQTFHSFQLQRAYTTDDGDSFEYTDSLRPQDLPKALVLFQRAANDYHIDTME